MSDCGRFEDEALLALEQGRPLDEHFRTCEPCRAALAAHEVLQRELSALDRPEPPPGWEERVWARLEPPALANRPRPQSPWPIALAALAGAAVVFLLVRPAPPPTSPAGLLLQVEPGQGRRGTSESTPMGGEPLESLTGPLPLGSRLVVSVSPGAARFAELRVYRNDVDLVLQTTVAAGRADPRPLRVALLLDAVGRYRAALLTSDRALPAPAASLDAEARRRPDVNVVLAKEVEVR